MDPSAYARRHRAVGGRAARLGRASLAGAAMVLLSGAFLPGTPSAGTLLDARMPMPAVLVAPPIGRLAVAEEALEDVWEDRDDDPTTPSAPAPPPSPLRTAVDALAGDGLVSVSATPSASHGHARDPLVEGSEGWTGAEGSGPWTWQAHLRAPAHLAVLRAEWGRSPVVGVPYRYRWQLARPIGGACPAGDIAEARFVDVAVESRPSAPVASPTRRSWFIDDDACALRLRVEASSGGPPTLRGVHAFIGARNVLANARARGSDGTDAAAVLDASYATSWSAPLMRGRASIEVTLPKPVAIDRVRLVIGADATTVPRRRGVGRTYAMVRGPRDWLLEASVDGQRFVPIARAPRRAGDVPLKLRRALLEVAPPGPVRALRLTLIGGTDDEGRPISPHAPQVPRPTSDTGGPSAMSVGPMVRALAAYAADDRAPVLPAPWVLSVNANPSPMTKRQPGAEIANDVYFTKFLQMRLAEWSPEIARDDRFGRRMGPKGELIDAPRTASSGEALEAIEGDDPALTSELVEQSSPRPLLVLSGAGDWDFAAVARPTAAGGHYLWDPLRSSREGGMGQLAEVVWARSAPLLGFCGGAQILALLDAARTRAPDAVVLDKVLARADGRSLRSAVVESGLERAWPGDGRPRAEISFDPTDPLFGDVANGGRAVTYAMPEWHADAVRPSAFSKDGPLGGWKIAARSWLCGPATKASRRARAVAPTCSEIPQAFHTTGPGFPIIGAQFHAEQRAFDVADARDPAWSTADPVLFVAAAWELAVDAWLAHPEPGAPTERAADPTERAARRAP
jgi:hypothetical protein